MRLRPGSSDSQTVRAWQFRPGLGSRRVQFVAFGISIVLHVVAVLLYPLVVRTMRPDAVAFPVPTDVRDDQSLIVIRLLDLAESEEPERPEEPEEISEVEVAEADARSPVVDGLPTVVLVPPGPTAAERLRPHLNDARLWAELPPEFYALTMEQQEELILSARIVEWYDSLGIAQAAEGRLTDWTFRDSNGGRWGVADGRIYLGDIALPLPINFGVPVGKRDETNRRLWEFDEISRQTQRYLIEQTWKERAIAIRARRDRERALARGDTIRSP